MRKTKKYISDVQQKIIELHKLVKLALIEAGNLFHRLGPATAKARSPLRCNIDLETERRPRLLDLRDPFGLQVEIASERYDGA